MTPVEKAAQAIRTYSYSCIGDNYVVWRDMEQVEVHATEAKAHERTNMLNARAVIAALLEPTVEMVLKGTMARTHPSLAQNVVDQWQAMINAALSESET